MEKSKEYRWTKFSPEVIRNAMNEFTKITSGIRGILISKSLTIENNNERWSFDDDSEFFAGYILDFRYAGYQYHLNGGFIKIHTWLSSYEPRSIVVVSLPKRADIETVYSVFEDAVWRCQVPKPPEEPWESKVRIFIGHGHKPLWKDLKDHLSDKHGFKVEAYEIGARGGLTITEVLEDMLTKSSIAFLVLTGETADSSGMIHARDNVIHEVGLFQGRLGFKSAIILLEEGVTEFSNIQGIQQLRFPKDSIRETFGDVLAIIKREFATNRT